MVRKQRDKSPGWHSVYVVGEQTDGQTSSKPRRMMQSGQGGEQSLRRRGLAREFLDWATGDASGGW